nr:uncharacterized protein LOC123745398 isoform X1 [Procambarus clarkii]
MDDTQVLECTQALADDWDNEEGDPKEQSLVAWLEVGGSRHDIHLGETKIGRDSATCRIVLDNKVLSKQHAVIEVDRDMHTIADLGSMNKTRIGKMILKPNVRFALQGGESLRFGDVEAKYIIIPKQLQNDDSGSETESESMFSLDDSGEKPASPVLGHHLPGLDVTKRDCTIEGDEGTTSDLSDFIPQTPVTARSNSIQCDGTNIKSFVPESPSSSQSTPLCKTSAKFTVPESPDNTSAVKNLGDDKDDSFFFDPSQPAKEKQVCKTQALSTLVVKEALQTEGYNSDASTDIEEDDVPTQLFSDVHDSASETDLKLYKTKEDTVKSIDRDMSDSGINLSKDNSSKSTGDVDQASIELDDDIFNQPTQAFPVSDKSLKVTSNVDVNDMSTSFEKDSDSTQEIVNAFKLPIVKNSIQSNVNDDTDTDDETMLPTQPFVATESPCSSRAQEMDDDIPTQLFFDTEDKAVFKKPFAMAPKTKKSAPELLTDRCNKTNESFNVNTNEDILDAPTQPFSSDEQNHSKMTCNNNDSILDTPTLPFDEPDSSYNFQLQNRVVQNEKHGVASTAADEDSDIFDQPTQPYSVLRDVEMLENDTPTPYFETTPANRLFKKEDKHDDKKESDDEIDIFNMPTQMYSTPKANSNVELVIAKNNQSKNTGLRSKRSAAPTCLNLSPVSVTKEADAYIDDDDLPPTQIFTSPSLSHKAPVLTEVDDDDDDVAPTQPFVNEEGTKESAGALKVSENSSCLGEADFDAPTQIFQEKSINKELDEHDAPTQIFSDDDKLNTVTPQKLLPGKSKKDTRVLPQGISQTWDVLDADTTQDIFFDDVLGIDKPCSVTPQQKDKVSDADINDSAFDTSEILVNPVETNLNDDISSCLNAEKDNNYSTKMGTSQENKKEERGRILEDLKVNNLEIKKQEMPKTYTNNENEGYNSDESTDIENELETPDKVSKPSVNVDSSHGSEMSHLELSMDSTVPENKDCMTPSSMTNSNSSYKKENDAASSQTSLTKTQEPQAEASERDKKSYQFKRVSRMAAPAKTSLLTPHSTENQSTPDSSTLIDATFSLIDLPDSEGSGTHESVCVKLQAQRSKGMLSDSEGHMLSDSESEDGNFSQKLFDLPPEFDDLKTEKSQDENMGERGDEASEMAIAKETPNRKSSNIDQETNNTNMDATEEKIKVQDKKNQKKKIKECNKIKVEVKDGDKEEISEDQTTTTKSVNRVDNSENGSSPTLTHTIRKPNTPVDVGTLQTSHSETDLECRRKSKRKIDYNNKSGNKSEEIVESPTKKIKNRNASKPKNKVDTEETQLESKTVQPNTTKAYLEKDDAQLSMIVESEPPEIEVVTPNGSALGNTDKEQKIKNEDAKIIGAGKMSLRGQKIINKKEENENSLPVLDKRKSRTTKINLEESTTKRGTRTKCKKPMSESLNIDSSTSLDSVIEVTIDDVQNIRHSVRRRNNSDSSTVSNLSIGSNRSVTRSAATTITGLTDPTVKGRRGKAAAENESDPNILPQLVGDDEDKFKTSKRKFVPKLHDRNGENEEEKKTYLVTETGNTKSGVSTNSGRTRGSRRSRIPDPPVAESDNNKTRTKTNVNKDDSVVEVNIEKTDETIIKKPELDAELKELENPTYLRARSSRSRKEPKRFSPERVKTQASQETKVRSSGRIRKSDISENIGELSKALPVKRGRKSTMPNLCASKSTENDEEVEIVATRQRSIQGASVVIGDFKNKKGGVQIVKKECRPIAAKTFVLQGKKESLQEADIQKKRTGHELASKASRKTRASIHTSHLPSNVDPIPAKKTRSSIIAEKGKGKDIINSLESKIMSQRDKMTKNFSTKEKNAQEGNSEVARKLQVTEMDIAKRGRQQNKGLSKDTTDDETSSQSSEDSHLSQRSKRKRGSDDSVDQLLSTPKSSRSGRSRLGSPSSKDIILWSPSQRQQQASTKPRVLFTGYMDAQDVKIVTDFGGTVVESPRECTVLVTINIRRTCKLLAVIGRGLPIVSPAWLSASKLARNFVDPWEYLVKDMEAEEKYGFRLDQSLRSASKVLLFEGLSIHATRSVKPPPDQMKEIIECSGGEYLDMPPKKYAPQVRIVSCPEDKKLWTSYKNLGIPILGTEFILTGLLRHELLLDEFPLG